MTTFSRSIFSRNFFIITFLILSINAIAQTDSSFSTSTRTLSWTAGFKFHNPGGITIKKYFGNKGLEFVAGRNGSYKNYDYYYRSNKRRLRNKGYVFDGYDHTERPWILQLHYLVHHKISFLPRLRWYYGAGIQSRFSNYYCNYHYTENNTLIYDKEYITTFSMGVDAVLGIEYTFKNFPVMLFAENTIYTEVFNSPLFIKGDISTGIRYTF